MGSEKACCPPGAQETCSAYSPSDFSPENPYLPDFPSFLRENASHIRLSELINGPLIPHRYDGEYGSSTYGFYILLKQPILLI